MQTPGKKNVNVVVLPLKKRGAYSRGDIWRGAVVPTLSFVGAQITLLRCQRCCVSSWR